MPVTKRVAILHFASPPTIGGVETTIFYQARGLADRGYSVKVISGVGGDFDARVPTIIEPLIYSKHPDVLTVKTELDRGRVTLTFDRLTQRLYDALKAQLSGCDVCIAHNVHTLHKNIALTAALARITDELPLRQIAWCHDLAWTNPQYQAELHTGYPWELLRTIWKNTTYVTVSEPRQQELADLLGLEAEQVKVMAPGVDPERFWQWTPTMTMLNQRLRLLDADGTLLLPARLTRRKNIALALKILAALRNLSGQDFRLVVTGPPGPHNPGNLGYLGELLDLRHALQMDECVHFVYAYGESLNQPLVLDDATIANLYLLADALIFPSIQEGFGIPILEAGLAGLPVFCADIPPLRKSGQDDAFYFDPVAADPDAVAKHILEAIENDARSRLKKRVRKTYRWETIIRERLVPLLEV
ncbi:MAG: glycosyltransferase family 4 protein [Anaerolineae bacterium]|nr:glycosyltransferase family 4 protein [Anaerolineae bacterium]